MLSLIDGLGYEYALLAVSTVVDHGESEQVLTTLVDNMQESIHALCCAFLCLQGTQSERIRLR